MRHGQFCHEYYQGVFYSNTFRVTSKNYLAPVLRIASVDLMKKAAKTKEGKSNETRTRFSINSGKQQ